MTLIQHPLLSKMRSFTAPVSGGSNSHRAYGSGYPCYAPSGIDAGEYMETHKV